MKQNLLENETFHLRELNILIHPFESLLNTTFDRAESVDGLVFEILNFGKRFVPGHCLFYACNPSSKR